MMKRFLSTMCALVATFLMAVPAGAGTITNGSFTVGIGPDGELYSSSAGIGFQRVSDGYDPLVPGTPRDSWGLAVNGGAGVYADYMNTGTVGVTSTTLGATVTSTTTLGYTVAQTFAFVAPNILGVSVLVTNTTGLAGSVVYQRDIDWDVFPTEFNETSSGSAITGNVIDSSYFGFESADPSTAYAASCAAGCSNTGDDGGGIKISLGTLAAGGSVGFEYFYGINTIGETPAGLLAEVNGLGAYYSILTQSSNSPTAGAVNSAIISVASSTTTPEPGSWTLILGGLGAVAAGWKRRKRSR